MQGFIELSAGYVIRRLSTVARGSRLLSGGARQECALGCMYHLG